MPNSGYPTPDNFEGDATFTCIPLVVPNKPEFLAAIYGLYGQMANEWFWKDFGTMPAQEAALLSSRGLALTDAYAECGDIMSCADIADCIETDTAAQEAIASAITNNTTVNNAVTNVSLTVGDPNQVNPTETKIASRNKAGFTNTEVAELGSTECNLNKLWAGIRHGIVARMDENLQDVLQDLSAIPLLSARVSAFIDIIPVIGDIAEALVNTVASVMPTLLSLYESYSSEATLDEIACDLFDMVCAECRYPTHQEIYDYFKNFALPATPSIGDWVLDTMMQLLDDPVGVVAKTAYFTMQVWQLGILYLQATFNGGDGTDAIVEWARLGEDFDNDNWTDLCDGCGEAYMQADWLLYQDQNGTYRTQGWDASANNTGIYIAGEGWQLQALNSNDGIMTPALPLDPSWRIRAFAFQTLVTSALGVQLRVTRATATGGTGIAMLNGTTGWKFFKNGLLSITGYRELTMRIPNLLSSNQTLTHISMIFDRGYAPAIARPTASAVYSATVYPKPL